jgi:hypothetical protein
MSLATGTAVFLFIASAVLTNITFLASSSGTTALSAPEVARDTATKAAQPAAGVAASGSPAPPNAASPNAAFSVTGPTPSPDTRAAAGAARSDDAQGNRVDQATAGPSGAAAAAPAPQERGQVATTPQQPHVLNPWLWLAIAFITGAIAIALHRRLRSSI